MRIAMAGLAALTVIGGAAFAGAAEAQPYGYYDGRHYDGRHYDGRYYDGRSYDPRYHGGSWSGSHYAPPHYGPHRPYYGKRHSYRSRHGYRYERRLSSFSRHYAQRCRTVTYWDPFYGPVRQRRCW